MEIVSDFVLQFFSFILERVREREREREREKGDGHVKIQNVYRI
jgi:hypothetical protein